MRLGLLMVVALGCTSDEGSGLNGSEFTPSPGLELELVPPDVPDAEALLVRIETDTWTLRHIRSGDDWDDGSDEEVLSTTVQPDGLWVDDQLMVPQKVQPDGTWDGGSIVDIGPLEVWYGSFDQAVSVQLSGGRFEGQAAFARELGPVQLTLDGEEWDLATYRWLEVEQ